MIRTRRSHLLAATALAGTLLGVTMVPQSARANPAQPVVGAGCFFAGVSGNTETFICSGAATPFIFSASTPPPDTRQIILANEFVTAAGVQVSAGNQNIIIDQVTVLGIVQQPVPDIVGGPNPGIGVQTFAVVNGDITVITSAANPNFGPAGNGLGNTATIFSDFAGIQTITFGTGNTSINANGNIVSGVFGIFSASAGGDISIVNNGRIGFNGNTDTVVPVGAFGIFAIAAGTGNIAASNTGSIDSNAFGIVAQTVDGNATGSNTGTINAPFVGIQTFAGGNGNATSTNFATGIINTPSGSGLVAQTNGTGDANSGNAGTINAAVHGLVAQAAGTGNAVGVNIGTINAGQVGMIAAANTGTALGINAGLINSGLDGMLMASFSGNALALNTSTGLILAGTNGMNVSSSFGGAAAQNDGGIGAGANGMLVQVFAGTGDAQALNSSTGIIVAPNAGFSGMRVLNFGTGNVFGQNDGQIFSDAAMEMQSFNGGNVAAVNTGLLAMTGNNTGDGDTNGVGIFARSQGGANTGNVNVSNTGAIIGDLNTNTVGIIASLPQAGSTGDISVANGLGPGPVVNESALIVSAGAGIRAVNGGGSGAIRIANFGDSAFNGGVFSLNSAAISVQNLGTGFTNIGNFGTLQGNGGSTAFTPTAADLQNAVISIDNTGVGAGNTPTNIVNDGRIATNSGLANGLAIATLTRDGVVNVLNNGTIVGRVDLTDGNDLIVNNGLWSVASNNRFFDGNDLIANNANGRIRTHGPTLFDMGAGNNLINNAGLIDVRNGGATGTGADGQVVFTNNFAGGTLVFNNAGGIIDMSNDVGNRTTNTVSIFGNFNASGNSRLGVDSFLGAPGSTSDRLAVQGNVTGLTSIIVNDVNPGPGAFNPTGIAVVNIAGAGNLSNFQLSSGSDHFNPAFGGVLDKGLFFYFLANDPNATSTGCNLLGAGNHCVSLFSLPSVTAQQLPIAITAAQTIFYETALMWEDRQTEVRDWWARGPLANIGGAGADMPVKARPPGAPPPPPPPRFGVWLKGMGSWADVDKNQTQSLAGQSFTFDLGYKQDTYAIVGGVDFGMPAFTDGVFVWGPMGGYVNSKVRFDQGGNTFKYTGGTVGLSASYLSGGFLGAGGWFADALVKADFLRLSVDTPLLASQGIDLGHVDVTTWGVIGNLGYRFNFGPAFFEPIGTLTYARVDIDNINNTLLGTNLNFGNGDSFRGAIGARLGTRFNWWAGHTNEAWILGRVWDEFAGNNNTVDLLNPGVPITVADDTFRHKAFGEVKAGLDFIAFGAGWSAHVNGGAKFGDDFTIWNAKGGVNYKW